MPSQLPPFLDLNDFVRQYGKTGLFSPDKHSDVGVGDIVLCRDVDSEAMLGKVVHVGKTNLVGKAKKQCGDVGDVFVLPFNKSRTNTKKPFNGNFVHSLVCVMQLFACVMQLFACVWQLFACDLHLFACVWQLFAWALHLFVLCYAIICLGFAFICLCYAIICLCFAFNCMRSFVICRATTLVEPQRSLRAADSRTICRQQTRRS